MVEKSREKCYSMNVNIAIIYPEYWLQTTFISIANYVFYIFSLKITWLVVVIILISLSIKKSWFWYKSRQEGSLIFQTNKEIKKHIKRKSFLSVPSWFEQLYYPSWVSVASMAIVAGILFLLAHTNFPHLSILSFDTSNHYQNLIAIHSGIGAVIFALLIFVAESLRDDDSKDRARVLLRESFLFPLTVLEILIFFIFSWSDINILSLLSLLVMASLTIISLGSLISVLLNKQRFKTKRLKLLKDRINQEIDSAVKERYANNILLQSLGEDKTELNYNPFSLDGNEQNGRHLFNSDKTGTITNIQLDKLKRFAEIVESEANKKGFSFYKNKIIKKEGTAGVEAVVGQTPTTSLQHNDKQYIHKKYHDEIEDDNKLLMSVDSSIVNDPIVIAKLNKLVREIFTIKQFDNFSEEIRFDVAGLRDQFISAIVEKKSGQIEELAKMYISLAENFLESMKRYGGGYSYEQAQKERGDWLGGWNEIKWLKDDINEIYRKAIKSEDLSIIRTVAYLPVAISIRAINYGDQYVYQEFLRFPTLLYWLSFSEKDKELKKFMVERSWRHLKEMSDYYIENQLRKKANKPEEIKKYADFTIPLFTTFQNLMKTAFEKKDKEAFSVFLDSFLQMYENFSADENFNAEHIKNQIQYTDDPEIKKTLEEKLALQIARDKVAEDIEKKKQQVVFGLCAYILDKFKLHPNDNDIKDHYQSIVSKLPLNLIDLTKLYESSRNFDTERFWNWDDWETIADGKVHIIDFSSKLDVLFCVKALLILQPMTSAQISAISLPLSRDLAFMAEDRADNRTLIAILNNISSESDKWLFVLNQTSIDKVPDLKSLLKKVKEDQELSEQEFIKTVAVSVKKVEEFKEEILKSFDKGSDLRKIFNRLGSYNDKTSEEIGTTVPSMGYNQIDQKAAFIEDWYVHYGGWGEQYGRGMADSEDKIVLEKMINDVGTKKNINKDIILTEISGYIESSNLENPVIFHTLEHLTNYEIKKNSIFFDRYRRDCPTTPLSDLHSYEGVIKINNKNIPVINVFVPTASLRNKILIADLKKFVSWKQYSPVDKDEDKNFKEEIFFIKVIDLNEDNDRRGKIMTENPDWLNEQADKEGYLKQHVIVNVFEKFQIEIIDSKEGIAFSVGEQEEIEE